MCVFDSDAKIVKKRITSREHLVILAQCLLLNKFGIEFISLDSGALWSGKIRVYKVNCIVILRSGVVEDLEILIRHGDVQGAKRGSVPVPESFQEKSKKS